MNGHHLIMGKLTDLLTGDIVDDTHDERYRQKIARLLVGEKTYQASDILTRQDVHIQAGTGKAVIPVDFIIRLQGRKCMMIQYAPGSIVTRRRSTLAISRLISGYYIPLTVVTNGEDAEILDGREGELVDTGLHSIPDRYQLAAICQSHRWETVSSQRAEIESRIAYAFEVNDRCPCDDTICRIPGDSE